MKDKEKYRFKKYSPRYPLIFKKEKQILKIILPNIKIEHVGSTSVPNLGGKGIIDIAISVSKIKIPEAIKKLQKIGYSYQPWSGDKQRKFFQKNNKIHIQLTHNNSTRWKSMIAVRNYLRKNKKARLEYSKIKKQAVKFADGEGKKYRQYKEQFLKNIK